MELTIAIGLTLFLGWLGLVIGRDALREPKQPQKWHLWLITGVLVVMALGCLAAGLRETFGGKI